MASLKERLDAAGYDTANLDEGSIISKLDAAGYDTSGLSAAAPKPNVAKAAMEASDPMTMIKSAAPSNVLGAAGVAAANAPGITSMLVNSLPGIGNPANIMPAAQNIAQNPGQTQQAARRAIETQGGAQMTPEEQTQSNMGTAAGAAMEMAGPAGLNKGVKPTGPFTAGFANPETATFSHMPQAQAELSAAKLAAKAKDAPEETTRLRRLMSKTSGVSKVAEEAITKVNEGAKDLSVTAMLAYRKALGAMQGQGGEFANDYKVALDKVSEMLAAKAPDVTKGLGKTRLGYLAREGKEFTLPALTLGMDHLVGGVKTAVNVAKTAGARNTAGAALGYSSPIVSSMGDIASLAYDKVFKKKPKKD